MDDNLNIVIAGTKKIVGFNDLQTLQLTGLSRIKRADKRLT